MSWIEVTGGRTARSRSYQDDTNPRHRRWSGTLARLHYPSVLESAVYDTEIDTTPARVDNAQLDGWMVTQNGWHYAIGQPAGKTDGWTGFGGRQGAHWFQFRLARVGYLHWPTRTWEDIGGAPSYDRANLSRVTRTLTIGPNEDSINVESIATWAHLWTTPGGGDLSVAWRAMGDGLKEEIIINQAGREWIAANRVPSTPLDETWFGFVFSLDWSDVPRVVRDGIQQDPAGDFADDGQPIELRDATGRLLAFLPVDELIAGDENDPENPGRATLRKRFYHSGDDHYLLVGVRCDTLAGLPAGPLIFDPTVAEQVGANADDVYVEDSNMTDSSVLYVGYYNSHSYNSSARWTGVTVEGTVDSASVELCYMGYWSNLPDAILYFEDADNPAAPSDGADFLGRDLTANNLAIAANDWSGLNDEDWFESGDIAAIIQELVDSYTISNDAVQCFVMEDEGAGYAQSLWYSYNNNSSLAPKLNIEYTEAGATIDVSPVGLTGAAQQASVSPGPVSLALNALGLSDAPQQANVLPGAVSAAMSLANATATAQSMTLESIATIVMNALGLTASSQAFTQISGAVSLAMNAAGITAAIQAATLAPGAVSAAMSLLSLLADAQSGSVTPGAVSLDMGLINLIGAIQSGTLSPGAVSAAISAINATADIQQTSVIPGAVTIQAQALALVAATLAATFGPQPATVLMSLIEATAAPLSATLLPGAVSLAMSLIEAAAANQSLTVSPGAVSVAIALLDATAGIQALEVSPGAVTIALSALSLSVAIQTFVAVVAHIVQMNTVQLAALAKQADLQPGTVTVSANAVALALSGQVATVTPGAVSVVLQAAGITVTPQQARIISDVSVAMAVAGLTGSIQSAALQPGGVTIDANALALTTAILTAAISSYEAHYDVSVSDAAVTALALVDAVVNALSLSDAASGVASISDAVVGGLNLSDAVVYNVTVNDES